MSVVTSGCLSPSVLSLRLVARMAWSMCQARTSWTSGSIAGRLGLRFCLVSLVMAQLCPDPAGIVLPFPPIVLVYQLSLDLMSALGAGIRAALR